MSAVTIESFCAALKKNTPTLAIDSLTPEQSLREAGLDSMDMMNLLLELEDQYSITISDEDAAALNSTNDFLSYLNRGLQAVNGQVHKNGVNALKETGNQPFVSAPSTKEPETEADIAPLVPQMLAVVTEQKARQVLIEGRWRCDFASCNYLGLDLHPQVIAAIAPAVAAWGVHPSWTRLVASPAIYEELETELARFVGAAETLVFPSLSLLHLGVIPLLAGSHGVIFKDIEAHNSLIEACARARVNGTEVINFRHNDLAELEQKLADYPQAQTKLIVIDGVYSMSGSYAPLPAYVRLAKQYNAQIYIDDAHGIGMIGQRPTPEMPYGYGGKGLVNYYGLRYGEDQIIYTAGLSKAFSSYGAFMTCTDKTQKQRLTNASTYIFSGPSPVASLASALAGVRVNENEGDGLRAHIYQMTRRLVEGARAIGFAVHSDHYFPIVSVPIGKTPLVVDACRLLWEYDILITPAVYPVVAKDKGVLRFSITAANTAKEIERALAALTAVRQMIDEAA